MKNPYLEKRKLELTNARKWRRFLLTRNRPSYDLNKKLEDRTEVINVPSVLVINNKNSIEFLSTLDESLYELKSAGRIIYLNLEYCSAIDSACAVWMLSILQRFSAVCAQGISYHQMSKKGIPPVRGCFPKRDSLAHKILSDIGFYRYLRTNKVPQALWETNSQMKTTVIRTGYNSLRKYENFKAKGGHILVEKLDKAVVELLDLGVMVSPFRRKISTALTEGLLNVADHAYEFGDYLNAERYKWWMVGGFQPESQKVNFVFMDRGCGIPQTIQERHKGEFLKYIKAKIKGGITGSSDPYAIDFAASEDITRTLEEDRGQGLKDIIDLVRSASGTIKIISGYGMYKLKFDGIVEEESHEVLKFPFKGTMLIWSDLQTGVGL